MDINKGQTCKFRSLLKDISPEKSTAADRGVSYGETIDSLIIS